jgi:hypothetical protein
MPSKSEAQRKLVFAKRGQYGSKSKTPEDWKWVWNDDWTRVEESSLTKNQIIDILLNRQKYGNKQNTPSYALWIWDYNDSDLQLNENRQRYIKFFSEAKTVDGYESPEPGDLPEAGADMLANIYAARRKAGDDKEKAAKIAWSQVRKKYPKKD